MKYKPILIHVLAWIAYLFTVLIGAEKIDRSFIIYLITVKTSLILIFYLCLYFVFPRYLSARNYFLLGWAILVTILLGLCIRFFLLGCLMGFKFITSASYTDLKFEFWRYVRLCLGFMGVALAIWYFYRNHETQNLLLRSELQSLKQQINPHFLYNTLNYFYSKSLNTSPEVARGIGLLSELMRYSIGSSAMSGFTTIGEEVKQIENYIELMQLRFNQKLQIEFHHELYRENQPVLQLVLLNFVENAFKHGEMLSQARPIKIRLVSDSNHLSFSISNSIANHPNDNASGIGLDNTRRRLDIAYPGKHSLKITESKQDYTLDLNIVW